MSSHGIRRALPGEAELLSALALRSKAYWGYDEAVLRACVEELMVTEEGLRAQPVYVIESERRVLGFYGLERRSEREVELGYLFVEPDAIGRGHGGQLLRHALQTARELGFRSLLIQGDPNAEPFYRAQGGVRIGVAPSASIPGRDLPLFRIEVDPG